MAIRALAAEDPAAVESLCVSSPAHDLVMLANLERRAGRVLCPCT